MSFILNPSRFSAGGADPGLTLLQSAALWLDASDAVSGAQWLRNKGTGGRALDARVGSVGSAQIINGALKLPGTGANYASVPDSAATDITGDIDMQLWLALPDWTPSGGNNLFCKASGAAATSAYGLAVSATGLIQYFFSDGASFFTASSTVAPTVTDGDPLWIRATRDRAGGNVKFYTAPTGASPSWTQLGTTVTGFSTATANNITGTLQVGAYGGTNGFAGTIYRAIVRNGYDGAGTVQFDADFTAQSTLATSFTESSSNAATVTINSTTGVDTNDPLLLGHTGTNYLYLPGASGNNASAPDSVALSITGDIDIQVRIAPTDWTPSTQGLVAGKWGSTTGNQAYGLFLDTSGTLRFVQYSGAAYNDLPSTVATGFTDGEAKWVRATYSASGGTVKFYTAPDASAVPSSWTQLGTTVAGVARTTQDTASALTLGESTTSGSNLLVGAIYRVRILDGYDGAGSVVFDANFTANTNQSSFTESSSNAATVTINRSTSGRKAVMVVRPTLLFGTDDYLEVADNDLLDIGAGEIVTAFVVAREFDTGTGNVVWLSKFTGSFDEGWGVIRPSVPTFEGRTYLESGATVVDRMGDTYAAGQRQVIGGIVNRTAETVSSVVGSVISATSSTSSLGSIATSAALRVGRNGGAGTSYIAAEIDQIVLFKGTALDSTQLGQIMSYLGVS